MYLLNTNTRFLHDEIINYSQNILSTLPAELCVLTLVNSGSEANDLALVMAKHYGKSNNMVCMETAYHGHVTACLEVSPYKCNKFLTKPETVTVIDSPC